MSDEIAAATGIGERAACAPSKTYIHGEAGSKSHAAIDAARAADTPAHQREEHSWSTVLAMSRYRPALEFFFQVCSTLPEVVGTKKAGGRARP